MKDRLTRHHLLPTSKGGTSHNNNILLLSDLYHRSFHNVFCNDTPIEQINRIININDTCLREEFKEIVRQILVGDREFIYKKGVYKKWKP